MRRLVQVCNAGEVTGGTGACAWSVTRALPETAHAVVCLGRVSEEMRRVFAPVPVWHRPRVDAEVLHQMRADAVLLHNTPAERLAGRLGVPSVQYLHSVIRPAPADRTVACSRWLAGEYARVCGEGGWGDNLPVLHQGVPRPPFPGGERGTAARRSLRDDIVVGRICTPRRAKWPPALVPFYAALTARFPQVRWEFVGCPAVLEEELCSACGGRAVFRPACWGARAWLWTWDVLLYHHPTLTESFGRTVGEALRAGCLPVVDRRGGFVEQLEAGGGRLCAGIDGFAEALDSITDRGTRWRMSRVARTHGERYSLERFGAALHATFAPLGHRTWN